jgi:hypothetical protein
MTLGTVAGSSEQIGFEAPLGQTPKLKAWGSP